MSASSLSVSIGRHRVLHDVDLQVPAGRWLAVVGPNGAGKSTLLKALAGLAPVDGGRVAWAGEALDRIGLRDRGRRLSWLGQNEAGADDLSVYDVAMIGRLPHQRWLGIADARDHQVVRDCLLRTQAWDWRDRPLGRLSGGERQRVLLARALAVQAGLMLMDEPVANLDPPHQADWLAIVRERVAAGVTVVSVLHELSLALNADELAIVDEGRIVWQGPAGEPEGHRAIERVFDDRVAVRAVDEGPPVVSLVAPRVDRPPPMLASVPVTPGSTRSE
ncbi:MAG: ABC transporter ATP-binding protein [Burkholderiaceae bacterium]